MSSLVLRLCFACSSLVLKAHTSVFEIRLVFAVTDTVPIKIHFHQKKQYI